MVSAPKQYKFTLQRLRLRLHCWTYRTILAKKFIPVSWKIMDVITLIFSPFVSELVDIIDNKEFWRFWLFVLSGQQIRQAWRQSSHLEVWLSRQKRVINHSFWKMFLKILQLFRKISNIHKKGSRASENRWNISSKRAYQRQWVMGSLTTELVSNASA